MTRQSDCSTNRFLAARHVMREWPDMPAPALSIFFSQWEGAGSYTDEKPKSGEYDDRQIAREWLKNQGLSKPSSGEAFGAVVDEDEDEEERALADYDKKIEAERKAEREEAQQPPQRKASSTWATRSSSSSVPLTGSSRTRWLRARSARSVVRRTSVSRSV
jgi:hypothetical protein